jgi:tripartite-type tricarboxylate transporter receptor subunit TctC
VEIVELLNTEINAALRDAKFKARITDLGATAFESTPAEFGRHLADETEKWGKVVVKGRGNQGGVARTASSDVSHR